MASIICSRNGGNVVTRIGTQQQQHRSFDLLHIPFTFRFAAALLLSIFRYLKLKVAGRCDSRLNESIDCFSRRK